MFPATGAGIRPVILVQLEALIGLTTWLTVEGALGLVATSLRLGRQGIKRLASMHLMEKETPRQFIP